MFSLESYKKRLAIIVSNSSTAYRDNRVDRLERQTTQRFFFRFVCTMSVVLVS